jgi:signal transduction histidine kinase
METVTRPAAFAPSEIRPYGYLAFGAVVLACFAGYFYSSRFFGPPEHVLLTFALGAVYAANGILADGWRHRQTGWGQATYFGVQLALVTAMLWLSPIRGFFAIIALPLVSEAVLDLRARASVPIVAFLYVQTIALWGDALRWVSLTELALNYATAFGFTIAFTLITRQAIVAKAQGDVLRRDLEEANTRLRQFASQAEELATTRERNRLAREIHDGVGHYLTVVKTQLDAAAALLPAQPERAREVVTTAGRLAAEALDDVRRSVGALRTQDTPRPLAEALAALVANGQPAPALAVEGPPRSLPSAVEHALFRAAQEGVTNLTRHARAQTAWLRLDFRAPDRVRLEVEDDGAGPAAPLRDGVGLAGLRERIALLGGSVETEPRPGGGFRLRVEVPA